MSKANQDRFLERLRLADEAHQPIRRKVYRLRRLVAGDSSVVGGPSAKTESDAAGRAAEFADFYVDSVREGRSNRLLEVVRTILYQSTFQLPAIEFMDINPELASINETAVSTLLGDPPRGCAALSQLRRSLVDYLIGGIGWARITFDHVTAIPGVAYVDAIDMLWDNRATSPEKMRWAAARVRECGSVWKQLFGNKGTVGKLGDEEVREVALYYDTDTGDNGAYAAYLVGGDGSSWELIETTDNPFYFQIDGYRIPFLPYEPIYYVWLPSVRYPVGIVEMALADQLAVWQSEDTLGNVVQRMPPWYAVQEGSMDEEAVQAFLDGEVGSIVEYKPGTAPPAQMGGGDVPRTLLERLQYHEKRMVGQVGVNPYASGAPVGGVQYATEVVAISQNASLNAQTVARAFAVFFARVVRKFMGALSVYGDFDIVLRINQVPVQFGPQDPLGQYIAPDAKFQVKEDSGVFISRQDKVKEASSLLQVAMALQQQFPNALPLAFRKLLLAMGETGKEWFEPAQNNMLQLMQQLQQTGQVQQGQPKEGAGQQAKPQGKRVPSAPTQRAPENTTEKASVGGAAGILSKSLK